MYVYKVYNVYKHGLEQKAIGPQNCNTLRIFNDCFQRGKAYFSKLYQNPALNDLYYLLYVWRKTSFILFKFESILYDTLCTFGVIVYSWINSYSLEVVSLFDFPHSI